MEEFLGSRVTGGAGKGLDREFRIFPKRRTRKREGRGQLCCPQVPEGIPKNPMAHSSSKLKIPVTELSPGSRDFPWNRLVGNGLKLS